MKKTIAALTFSGILLAGTLGRTLASNEPEARFKGGFYDGYDQDAKLQAPTDWAAFRQLITARHRGGSYDGYAKAEILEATIPVPKVGTLIVIR